MLAVKKGTDFNQIIKKIGTDQYPEDFFEFTSNRKVVEEFAQRHSTNLSYLEKDFDLYINHLLDYDESWEDKMGKDTSWGDLEMRRYEQMNDLVKAIQATAEDNIIVMFFGDPGHTGFFYEIPQIYNKAEIIEIFASENVKLINSLLENQILKLVGFEEEELAALRKSLRFSLKDILLALKPKWEKCDRMELKYFKPQYFQLFKEEYIDFIIEHIFHEFFTDPYLAKSSLHFEASRLQRELKMTPSEFKAKIKKLVDNCLGEDLTNSIYNLIVIIKEYFGDKELLRFLDQYSNIKLLYSLRRIRHFYSVIRDAFSSVSEAVVAKYHSSEELTRSLARKGHTLIMDLLTSLITNAATIKELDHLTVGTIGFLCVCLIRPYSFHRQEELILPTLHSIPHAYLTHLLQYMKHSDKQIYFQKLLTSIQKMESSK